MTTIDKQRVAAVATLESLGYTFSIVDGWTPPATTSAANPLPSRAEADAMHGILMTRADALQGCIQGSPEEAELKSIVDALKAYEARRWPAGNEPGGKG